MVGIYSDCSTREMKWQHISVFSEKRGYQQDSIFYNVRSWQYISANVHYIDIWTASRQTRTLTDAS